MKIMKLKSLLLTAAVVCALGMTACGSTGSISSLTDQDSTAALTDADAAAAADTAAGTVTKAADEETVDNASVLPEIQAQTVDAQPVDEDGQTTDADAADSSEDAQYDDDDSAVPTAAADPAPADVSYENDDDPEAVAAADAIDVAETDEGGVHGEGNYATVIADDVNVRSYPEVDEDDENVLGTLSYGDEVRVLGNEDGWYKIEFDGEIGYASAGYFS